jgi:hypothetical protein
MTRITIVVEVDDGAVDFGQFARDIHHAIMSSPAIPPSSVFVNIDCIEPGRVDSVTVDAAIAARAERT